VDKFIVKVQWPISTNEPIPHVLIYNEDRTIRELRPANEAWRKVMRGELKAYFWAHLQWPSNRLFVEITNPAPMQEW